MGLYLGKEKLCSCDELVYTSNSMKFFFDAGGKLRDMATVTSVDELFQKSDTADVTDMSYMFYYCRSLTSVPAMNTSKVTSMYAMFSSCSKLTSVPAMDTSKVTDMGYMFSSCSSLAEIHMYGMKVSFDISASTKFTREALVEILNNLATITSSKTLTMGSTNLAKLTDDDKLIATNKGWTLA